MEKIISSDAIFIDESPVKVQAQKKVRTAYMWVLAGGPGSDPPYRCFHYRPVRKHGYGEELLSDFTGILHSDKYGVYEKQARREGIIWCPSWSHIRRKFVDAETGDKEFRDHILEEIRRLYLIERQAWELSPEDRVALRLREAEPIIDRLLSEVESRLTNGPLLPKSKYREALSYLSNLSRYVKNYTHHASACIDNNTAERSIRPLAIGRKNWLFVGSDRGGHSAAVLLSLMQTCRAIGANPWEYLDDMLRRFQSHPANRLSELLPDAWLASRS